MITLTFTDLSEAQATTLINAHNGAAAAAPATTPPTPAPEITEDFMSLEEPEPAPASSKKKTTKKKTTAKKTKPEATVLTETDIRKAVTELSEAKGLEAARDLLGEYDAARIPELKQEEYAAFILDANKRIEA